MGELNKSTDYFDFIFWRFAICSAPWWGEVQFPGDKTSWKQIAGLFGIYGVYWKER